MTPPRGAVVTDAAYLARPLGSSRSRLTVSRSSSEDLQHSGGLRALEHRFAESALASPRHGMPTALFRRTYSGLVTVRRRRPDLPVTVSRWTSCTGTDPRASARGTSRTPARPLDSAPNRCVNNMDALPSLVRSCVKVRCTPRAPVLGRPSAAAVRAAAYKDARVSGLR